MFKEKCSQIKRWVRTHSLKKYTIVKEIVTEFNRKINVSSVALIAVFVCILVYYFGNRLLDNSFSNMILYYFKMNETVGMIFVVLILLLTSKKVQLLKKIMARSSNWVDIIIMELMIVSLAMILLRTPIEYINDMDSPGMQTVKSWWILFIVASLFGVFRVYRVYKGVTAESQNIELKQLVDHKIQFKDMIAVGESAVDYDLLGRDIIISHLASTFRNKNFHGRLVIGLNGKWGSGKTTIINNVIKRIKSESDIITIRDFDPWISDNKSAIIRDLLKSILVKADLGITDWKINQFISAVTVAMLGKSEKLASLMTFQKSMHYEDILKDINLALQQQSKKIIIILDNLDRITPENALFILNIVNNILTFNNLVVVLVYDSEIMQANMKSVKINQGFLEKIIQQEYRVPMPESNKLSQIYFETLTYFKEYIGQRNSNYLNFNYKDDLRLFCNVLVRQNVNIRSFKRFINSEILTNESAFQRLDFIDYLIISYIKFTDFKSYQLIYRNEYLLISSDRDLEWNSVRDVQFDKKVNNLFQNFTEDINELLQMIFPFGQIFESAKPYAPTDDAKDYLQHTSRAGEKHDEIQARHRICSGNFFQSYFYLNPQPKEMLVTDIGATLKSVVNGEIKFLHFMIKFDTQWVNDRGIVIKTLDAKLEKHDIGDHIILNWIKELMTRINKESHFKISIPYECRYNIRMLHIFLSVISEETFETFCGHYLRNADFLKIMLMFGNERQFNTIDTQRPLYEEEQETASKKNKYFVNKIDDLYNCIVHKRVITLFSKQNYKRGLLRAIFEISKRKNDVSGFKEYLSEILSFKNIVYILAEALDVISDEKLENEKTISAKYAVYKELDDCLDLGKIEQILSDKKFINNLTQNEKKVISVYLTSDESHFSENTIMMQSKLKNNQIFFEDL